MDGRRFPSQTGAQGTLVRAVYGRNLRSMVIATCSLSALWTLLWAIASFRDVNLDKDNNYPKLANYSLVLGITYIVTCAIEIFGVVAAVSQKLPLVQAYATGSVISSIVVVAASLFGIVIHFVDKNDIINECTKLATGASITFRFGFFGSSSQSTLTPSEAASFCHNGWDHASWSDIISLIVELLLGVLFSLIAIAYYRQLVDPTSAANAFRAPSNQMRGDMYPEHYNPPYDAAVPNLGYGTGPMAYGPPPGPPPRPIADYDAADLSMPPGYEGGEYGSKFGGTNKDSENPFTDFEGHGDSDRKVGESTEFHV